MYVIYNYNLWPFSVCKTRHNTYGPLNLIEETVAILWLLCYITSRWRQKARQKWCQAKAGVNKRLIYKLHFLARIQICEQEYLPDQSWEQSLQSLISKLFCVWVWSLDRGWPETFAHKFSSKSEYTGTSQWRFFPSILLSGYLISPFS